MNVIDYLSLRDAYNSMTSVLQKNIHCGDEDGVRHINNLKLGEIADFLSSISVGICQSCKGTGIVYFYRTGTAVEQEQGTKSCPSCNGNGGHFKLDEVDCTI